MVYTRLLRLQCSLWWHILTVLVLRRMTLGQKSSSSTCHCHLQEKSTNAWIASLEQRRASSASQLLEKDARRLMSGGVAHGSITDHGIRRSTSLSGTFSGIIREQLPSIVFFYSHMKSRLMIQFNCIPNGCYQLTLTEPRRASGLSYDGKPYGKVSLRRSWCNSQRQKNWLIIWY